MPFSIFHKTRRNLGAVLQSSRLAVPLTLAAVLGMLTGLSVVIYVRSVEYVRALFQQLSVMASPFIPSLLLGAVLTAGGGLLVGILTRTQIPESREQGVPDLLKAMALRGGYISSKNTLVRALASVLTLGSGFSTGREGPAVHLGAGIGSKLGRLIGMNPARVKNFAACGAAAGIAAVFNAPITAVMFCLEIVFRDFGVRALSTIVIAAVSSSIISRIFLGNSPAFSIPFHRVASPLELPLYALLGVFSGLVACLFIIVFDRTDRCFEKLVMPQWLKPALGGALVGLMGFGLPGISGMGFETMEAMMHGTLAFEVLLMIMLVKILATSVSLGSGSTGGTFAPALFIGGGLGGVFGMLVQGHVPFASGSAGAYALVGMASVFAGAFHAPVTAILLVFEMTGDYHMILPLMASTVIAASISQRLQPEPIDTIKLKRQGVDVGSVESTSFLGTMLVRDAMNTGFETISNQVPAAKALEKIAANPGKTIFSVNAQGEVTGILTTKMLENYLVAEDAMTHVIVEDIASPVYEVCYPEDALGDAVHIMKTQNLETLLVVSPERHGVPLGVLKSEDIFRVIAHLAVKREELLRRTEDGRSGKIASVRFRVHGKSPLAGQEVRLLALPEGVVLNVILRNQETLIPHGNTKIQAYDKIIATVLIEHEEAFRVWLEKQKIHLSFKEQM